MNVQSIMTRHHSPRRTLITDLPADVLLIVAREVLASAARPAVQSGLTGLGDMVDLDPWRLLNYGQKKPDCSAVRPYQELLTSLFPLWRVAMSPISSLWTSIIIWTGRNPTSLETIQEHLNWSGDRPLDIFILRRYDPSLEDPTEKAHVKAVIALLLPHIQRWRVLCMKLLHSSSLPRPHVDIVGPAEELTRLHLDFLIDDLITSRRPVLPTGRLETPLLATLSMGGVYFRDAYVTPGWDSKLLSSVAELTITDYQSCNGPFPFIDLVSCLTNITSGDCLLKLENLQLDCSYTGPALSYMHPMTRAIWNGTTHFIGMDAAALAHYPRLLRSLYLDDVAYVRCTTPVPPGTRLALAAGVIFSDIHDQAVLFSLLRAISNPDVGGYTMSFVRCSCLREVLRALGQRPTVTPDVTDSHSHWWLFPGLKILQIVDCDDVTSADLRALVHARAAATEVANVIEQNGDQVPPEDDVTTMSALFVQGCGELAPDDREWFSSHLGSMVWND